MDPQFQVPYHPPIPDPATFAYHIQAAQDAMIDSEYPDMNFKNWYAVDESGRRELLTVGGTQLVIIRWNLSEFAGKKVDGAGLLELTTYSLQRSSDYEKDFGMVRVTEILDGDPEWNRENVTFDKLRRGLPLNSILNSQMIIDVNVYERRGGTNLITISKPVLQRMVDGKTLGLAIRPLGAVNASFYAGKNQEGTVGARLHLNVKASPVVPIHRDF
jgi:hypothetical protein